MLKDEESVHLSCDEDGFELQQPQASLDEAPRFEWTYEMQVSQPPIVNAYDEEPEGSEVLEFLRSRIRCLE